MDIEFLMECVQEKPKRTRQKKIVSTEISNGTEQTSSVKKTGGKAKKPIQVVAVVTPEGIEGTFTPEPRRPLIVHLPFQSTEVNIGDTIFDIKYDPNPPPQPMPYDENNGHYFQVNSENSSSDVQVGVEQEGWKMPTEKGVNDIEVESKIETEKTVEIPEKTVEVPEKKYVEPIETTIRLLNQYQTKKGETFKVPEKTDISCFWTTHVFEGPPCFIPIREENSVYTVYGNFSSPECALAYLLEEHLDSHVRWERMALLHRMYKVKGRLYPAPPRESLKKFGGPYSIDEYNKIINDGNVRVDIHVPPMISILGTLDTKPIDFYDSSVQNTFTGGFSLDRFKSWSEQGGALRLKRSKPLKDRESTLDSCIQISVKRMI